MDQNRSVLSGLMLDGFPVRRSASFQETHPAASCPSQAVEMVTIDVGSSFSRTPSVFVVTLIRYHTVAPLNCEKGT